MTPKLYGYDEFGLHDFFDVARGATVKLQDAAGDDVTDDSPAFQRTADTLTYAAANVWSQRGGELYVPNGKYVLLSPIVLIQGTRIVGESQEGVIIQPAHNGDAFKYVTADGSSATRIQAAEMRNVTISYRSGFVPTAGCAIKVEPQTIVGAPASVASRVFLENVYIYGAYVGVNLYAVQGGYMRGCSIQFCRTDGFLLDGYATEFHIQSCQSSGNGASGTGHGYHIKGAAYCSATASGADSNAQYGWYWDEGSEQTAYANTMLACGGEGNNSGAFYLRRQRSMSMISCLGIMDSGAVTQDGLNLDECLGVTLISVRILTQANCLGAPLRITNWTDDGTGTAVALVMGGQFGPFSGSTTVVNGLTAPICYFGWQSDNRFGINNAGQPSRQFEVVKPAHGNGTAAMEWGRFVLRSDNEGGSGRLNFFADGGPSHLSGNTHVGYIEQNGVVGPYTFGNAADTLLGSAGAHRLVNVNGTIIQEFSGDAPAPEANSAVFYARDNGSGKTQFCVRFSSGAVQVLATQP